MQTSQSEANEEQKKRGRVKLRCHRRRWKAADEWFSFPLALSSQISLQAWLIEQTPMQVQATSTHLSANHRPKMSASMASLCLGLKRNSDTSSGECSSGSQSPSSPRGRKTRWNDTELHKCIQNPTVQVHYMVIFWAWCDSEGFFRQLRKAQLLKNGSRFTFTLNL